jgi:hypothetical protein
MLCSDFWRFHHSRPANPFIARERRNILPFCSCRNISGQRLSEIRRQGVYRPCCQCFGAHTFILSRLSYHVPACKTKTPLLEWCVCGGQARIRTLEGVSQEIYSLPRLTASVPTLARRCKTAFRSGAAPSLHFAYRLRFARRGRASPRGRGRVTICSNQSFRDYSEMEPTTGFEPVTSSLPWKCSTS